MKAIAEQADCTEPGRARRFHALGCWRRVGDQHRYTPPSDRPVYGLLLILSFSTFLLNSSFGQENMNKKHPYISYDLYEIQRTANEHREVSTSIFLSADDYVGFRYWERVSGSTAETVKTLKFSNEYQRKATEEEQSRLIQALLDGGVFDLIGEDKNESDGNYSYLNVRIPGREARVFFRSLPATGKRKIIHDILFQFAHEMSIDQPNDPAKATTISEGDTLPPRDTTIVDLLANPEKFHGKRVSVVGFYHGEFEASGLGVDERSDFKRILWRGEPSPFANRFAIFGKNNVWVRIDGVFLKGPAGHMDLAPGEIIRLTQVRPVLPPMDWAGINYMLSNLFLYFSGLLIWPLCAFLWRKKKRRMTALRWAFWGELVCLLVLTGVALFSKVEPYPSFLWFWFWVAVNLAFTLAAAGSAVYGFSSNQKLAV